MDWKNNMSKILEFPKLELVNGHKTDIEKFNYHVEQILEILDPWLMDEEYCEDVMLWNINYKAYELFFMLNYYFSDLEDEEES